MKRLLSALMLVVLLAQFMPLDALATVGRVLTREELDRAYALTGLGEGEGVYHNGMKPNASWSAAQLSDYLEDKLSLEIYNLGEILSRAGYALNDLKEKAPERYARFEGSQAYAKLQGHYAAAEALRQEMRYYMKTLDESAGLIAEMRHALLDSPDTLFDSEKARKSARIEEAVAALVEDRQYVVDHIDEWAQKTAQLQLYLSVGPDYGEEETLFCETEPYMGEYLSALFDDFDALSNRAPVSVVNASNTRMSRLSAQAGLRANDADAHVTVITDRQICIALVTEQNGKKTPVPGVGVTVKDLLNPGSTETCYYSDPDGLVVLPTNRFTVDRFDVSHIRLAVDGEARGFRSLYIDDLDMDLGQQLDLVMIPLNAGVAANGTAANADVPYIVSGEFNKKDIMYSDYEMVFSTANDYEFEIKVEVRNAGSYPELMMSWYENDGTFSDLKQCWANATTHEGNVYTFKGPWKQKFSPNASKAQRPAFSFGKEGPKFVSRLVSVRSAVDKPLNEGTGAGGGVFGKVLDPKNIEMGLNIPLGEDKKIHVGLNLPFTEYLPKLNVDPGGYVAIYMGSDILGDLVEGTKVGWKSQDLKEFKRAQTYVQKKAGFANYKAQYNLAYDFYKEKAWKFLGESRLKFGLYAVATGRWQLDNDDPDVKTRLVTARTGAGFTLAYSYSWTISYPLGPVPTYIAFTLGLSAGFAVDFDFNFCWINGEFRNWEFKPLKTLTINVRFSFSAQLGVGIKGFLEGYVKFSASLNCIIRVSLMGDEPASLALTYACNLTFGVTVFFVDFSFMWTFAKGQLWPREESNLLSHYMNAASNDGAPTEVAHQEPLDYPDLQTPLEGLSLDSELNTRDDMRLVTVGKYTYVFYMTRVRDRDGNLRSRVCWRRVGDNLSQDEARLHSMQEVFESTGWIMGIQSDWDKFARRDDYDFDVTAAEGFVFVLGLNAGKFDEHGLPLPHKTQSYNLNEYAVVLEPDAGGNLTYRLSARDKDNRDRWAATCTPFYIPSNPRFRYAGVEWSDRAARRFSFFEFYADVDKVHYDEGLVKEGTGWIIHAGEDNFLDEYSAAKIGNSMGEGYERVKLRTTMAGAYRPDWGDFTYNSSLPFVALSAPKDGASGERAIEYFDWHMNNHRGYNQGVSAIALARGDIHDFEVVTARVPEGSVSTVFYVDTETNGEGVARHRLKGLYIAPIRGNPITEPNTTSEMALDVTSYDYDVTLPADSFSVGYIGTTPYLYWWTALPKKDNVNEIVWRVWAMAYDPAVNVMSDAFVLAQFDAPRMRIEGAPRRMFDPMTAQWILKGEQKFVDTVPTRIELTSGGTGHLVVTATEKAYGEEVTRTGFYNFREQLLATADVLSAVPQALSIKAGDFEDIDLGVMNTGNVALATFDVELREVDAQGREGALVETVHVNLVNPEMSTLTLAGGKVVMSGKQVAHRAEDYDYSPRQRDFIHRQEALTYRMKVGREFALEGTEVKADESRHLTSNALMPGSLGDFMASFIIPENWEGRKNLRLRLSRVSVESNWLRNMANASGIAANAAAEDGNESVELVYALNRDTGKLELQKPAVSNGALDAAIANGLYANAVEGGRAADIIADLHDIDIDHRVYAGWDGQDWLDIIIRDCAATGESLKLSCAVYLDGADEPLFVDLPYYEVASSNRRTQTVSLPVSALVDDPAGHERARVCVTAVGREEDAVANNEFTVYLGGDSGLRFEQQPEDVTVQEGEDVSVQVQVVGGVPPYAYQWQVWDPSRGEWVDLPGFTGPTLSRRAVERKWDGCRFRCVATDARGAQVVSREITLRVRGRVPTGDGSHLPLYLMVALAALALLWWLRRRSRA